MNQLRMHPCNHNQGAMKYLILTSRGFIFLFLMITGVLLSMPASAEEKSLNIKPTDTPVRITIGNTAIRGYLNSTRMAQQLAQRLPLTLSFGNHPDGGGFPTKVTHLVPPLDTTGTELGAAPGPGDIALFVPSGNLGLYYGQLAHWDGAVILGAFSGNLDLIEQQKGPFTVKIEKSSD